MPLRQNSQEGDLSIQNKLMPNRLHLNGKIIGRIVGKCLGLLVLLFLLANYWTAQAEIPTEVFDTPKVVALQNRQSYLNEEADIHLGYMPADAFTKSLVLGASYTHFFEPYLGWEILNLNVSKNYSTSLKNELLNKFSAEVRNVGFGGILDFPSYFVTTNLIYTPIYNKNLLFNTLMIHGEISFLAGGGVVHFNTTGNKPVASLGMIMRYFTSPSTSIKVDVREHLYFDRDRGLDGLFVVLIGFAIQLGSPPARI